MGLTNEGWKEEGERKKKSRFVANPVCAAFVGVLWVALGLILLCCCNGGLMQNQKLYGKEVVGFLKTRS